MHTQPVTMPVCPRCLAEHRTVVARPLRRPVGEFPSWAICPATFEPVLVRLIGHEERMATGNKGGRGKRTEIVSVPLFEFI